MLLHSHDMFVLDKHASDMRTVSIIRWVKWPSAWVFWQVYLNMNVCPINKSWKQCTCILYLYFMQVFVHFSNAPILGM